jgi:predicted transcriptional regulator
MKEKTMRSFSEVEERKVAALRVLGLSRIESRVVVCLSLVHDEINPRIIEREADLRQPEVSIAMRRLRGRGDLDGFKLLAGLDEIAQRLYDNQVAPLTRALTALGVDQK